MKKLNKDHIRNNPLWLSRNQELNWNIPTNSWFNICSLKKNNRNNTTITINNTNIRAKMVIIKPTPKQKKILFHWLEIYRQVYNTTVKYIKNNSITNFKNMRKIIDARLSKNLKNYSKKYKILKHTRDNAIKDVLKAYKTGFTNLKRGHIRYFRLRPKKHNASLVLEPTAFSTKKNGFATRVLGKMISSSPLKDITRECRLCYDFQCNRFKIFIPCDKVTNTTVKRQPLCALDPGIRTFQTIYSPSGNLHEICNNSSTFEIKKLINRIDKAKGENPEKYKSRLRAKLKNKITDMHWKACNFLCKRYDTIVIGNMSTRSITSRRSLHKSVNRECYVYSHFLFKQRLQSKCDEYDCKYVEIDESYTSKTCSSCGEINNALGSNKTFQCPNCNLHCDRDINGARNIYYKYLQS